MSKRVKIFLDEAFDDDMGDEYLPDEYDEDDYEEDDDGSASGGADPPVAVDARAARRLRMTGSGGLNKEATDINEYAAAAFCVCDLSLKVKLPTAKVDVLVEMEPKPHLIVMEQGLLSGGAAQLVAMGTSEDSTVPVPTIAAAIASITGTFPPGGQPNLSKALHEANSALQTLLQKGGAIHGGKDAVLGLATVKIAHARVMIEMMQRKFSDPAGPFKMQRLSDEKLPLVQVVGATNAAAAQASHGAAVQLFIKKYGVPAFCAFTYDQHAKQKIVKHTFAVGTNYHERSPSDILVAIDARCFSQMAGYNGGEMGGLPLIVGFSLKSVLGYGDAPFANPGLPSVLRDLEQHHDIVLTATIDDVKKPYKLCVDHCMAAAKVKTKKSLKAKFQEAKKKDNKKLGYGGAQDKLLKRLARACPSGSPLCTMLPSAPARVKYCTKVLSHVRENLKEVFQNILRTSAGQTAMKIHIIELWKKIKSPIGWFKLTGQGSDATLRSYLRSGGRHAKEGYMAKWEDPTNSPAMDLLRSPDSRISIRDGDNPDIVSFVLLIKSADGRIIPLIQIRAKKESYVGTSLKLSGEACPKSAGGGCGGRKGGYRRKRKKRTKRKSRCKRKKTKHRRRCKCKKTKHRRRYKRKKTRRRRRKKY